MDCNSNQHIFALTFGVAHNGSGEFAFWLFIGGAIISAILDAYNVIDWKWALAICVGIITIFVYMVRRPKIKISVKDQFDNLVQQELSYLK